VDGQSDKHDKPNTVLAFQNFGNVFNNSYCHFK